MKEKHGGASVGKRGRYIIRFGPVRSNRREKGNSVALSSNICHLQHKMYC